MDIGTYEAKTHFAELLVEVQSGKEYTITKHGKPIARILPAKKVPGGRASIVSALAAYRELEAPFFDIRSAIEEGRR
ncbi:MAG: type II toxin-antitoxin system prevent-host-death family antitoxin [Spirochaetota bacterium]